MGPPGGGRNPVTPRFIRHFNIISVAKFNDDTMTRIFSNIVSFYFKVYAIKRTKNLIWNSDIGCLSKKEVLMKICHPCEKKLQAAKSVPLFFFLICGFEFLKMCIVWSRRVTYCDYVYWRFRCQGQVPEVWYSSLVECEEYTPKSKQPVRAFVRSGLGHLLYNRWKRLLKPTAWSILH